MRQFRPYHFAWLILTLSIFIAVRLWRLTDSCLWFDEIFSVHAAEHGWNELFSFVALDLIHPPLFYVLLKLWIAIGGDGLLWLRAFPVLFAIAAVAPFLLLCRELKVRFWTMILALFLLATNGCLIKYAQEVRMYSLLMCLSVFSLWLFVRLLNRGSGIFALTIVNLFTVYTHYFGWLTIAAEIFAVAVYQRKYLRQMAAMAGVVFVGSLPWAMAVSKAVSGGSSLSQNIGWVPRPTAGDIGQFFLDLIEPFYYQPSSVDAASDYRVSIPIMLIAAVGLIAYLADMKTKNDDKKNVVRFVAFFALTPLVIAFIASWLLPYSIWGTRHLIIVFAPVAVLIAVAISSIQIPWLKTAALTLLILFTGFAFVRARRSRRLKPIPGAIGND